jgi:hypothetical protein
MSAREPLSHLVSLWWSESARAGEIRGQSGEDIWRCSCGWRDDDDYSTGAGPAIRAVRHASLNGGSMEFPDPATGWHDPSLGPQAGDVNER